MNNTPNATQQKWVEIDLDAVSHNLHQIREKTEPVGTGIMAIVKDNAYGHGAIEVSRTAAQIPVQMLGVATVGEAMELRRADISLPILLLCCILPDQVKEVVQHNITQTVCDLEICKHLSEEAARQNKIVEVHVKIDTGMGRIGIMYDQAVDLMKKIIQLPNIRIDGMFTHFASADEDQPFTSLQYERFVSVIEQLEREGIKIPLKHAANSSAILNFPSSYLNMVRPGLIIYGVYPPGLPQTLDLKPVMSFKTKVVYLKEVPAGWDISYGRTYTTDKITKVATLAVGYGDGYNRRMSNKGEVIIRGKIAPIIGTVCMDQCLCDVTHIPHVSIGDEVILIGKQGINEITADDLAQKAGTISYEVFCNINSRVQKFYISKSHCA
jgi:alanine racemase